MRWLPYPSLSFAESFPDAERPYKAFGYPVVPVLFLLVAGWLIYITFSTISGRLVKAISL
jgi:hypothetical protein